MDDEWIDYVAQAINHHLRRRELLAALPTVLITALLGLPTTPADARKRKKKKRKKNPKPKPEPTPDPLPLCQNGKVRCGNACIDTNQDNDNCGQCGAVCRPNESCCAGNCRATQDDVEHCGACHAGCASGNICLNSTCGMECGASICPADGNDPDCCAGACTNVKRDSQHCGECGTACGTPETCCGGVCTDTANDPEHCGACGAACGQDELCVEGQCGTACGTTEFCLADSQKPGCCDETCVNLDRNPDHCGACGHACAETERCWNGVCVCGDVCHKGCQFTSIQSAINAADSEGTVRVCAGTYNGAIAIDKKLTLIGAGNTNQGTFIQGRHGVSAVMINRGGAEIRGFTISGGGALQLGGGVNTAADLTMVDCTISHNTAVMNGGGICNLGFGLLVLRRCIIADNTALREGGGLYNSSRVEVTDCVIQQNEAPRGAGIYNFWGRQATLTDTGIQENTASDLGGGIFNGGVLTLINSTVTLNEASDGGGIFNDPSTNGSVEPDDDTSISDNLPNDCANTDACSA